MESWFRSLLFQPQKLNDGTTGKDYWTCGFMAEKIWEGFRYMSILKISLIQGRHVLATFIQVQLVILYLKTFMHHWTDLSLMAE
jgi:hypothetical protein